MSESRTEEITLQIVAMEPTALLNEPGSVFIRLTPEISGMGAVVELRGAREDVALFVADNWGAEEVEYYPEIRGLIAPGERDDAIV